MPKEEEPFEIPQVQVKTSQPPEVPLTLHKHTGADTPKIKLSNIDGVDYSGNADLTGESKTVHFNLGGDLYYFKVYPTKTDVGGAGTNWEDLTAYTKVDPNSHFYSVTNLAADFAIFKNEDMYLYKDYTAGYFDGDFTHLVTVNYDSSNDASFAGIWGLANDVNDFKGIEDIAEDYLVVYLTETAPDYFIYLQECVAGATYSDFGEINNGTDYFLKIVRNEAIGTYGTLYCYIYSDEARTVLVDTLTLTLHKKTDFRYIYAVVSYNSGDILSVTATMKKLILT